MGATILAAGGVLAPLRWLTDHLVEWSTHRWFLLVIVAVAMFDSLLPLLPSETAVIVGGVAVAAGDAPYGLIEVIVAGGAAAVIGDNLAYGIGRRFSHRFALRAERRPKFKRKLAWTDRQIKERGGLLLITARFLPGGRTLMTLSCGMTRQRWWWFAVWDLLACGLWAGYAAGLARLIGVPFRDHHATALWIAFATAVGINLLAELIRHVLGKRREAAAATD